MTSDELKQKRIDLGMTQSELARHLGVTLRQVQNYESGYSGISKAMAALAMSIRPKRKRNNQAAV